MQVWSRGTEEGWVTPGEERQPLHSLEAGQETLELKSLVDMGEPGGTGEWL